MMEASNMNNWVLNNNNAIRKYNSFEEAINEFLKIIKDHLWINSDNNKENESTVYGYSCEPFSFEVFFHTKYQDRTITDEEIVLESRIGMLLDYFLSKDKKQIQDNALKVIKHSISYHGKDEYHTDVKVDVDLNSDEITLDISVNNGFDSYIRSNAFIFDDENRTYYFNSRQYVEVSNNKDDLGKVVELNISLSKE